MSLRAESLYEFAHRQAPEVVWAQLRNDHPVFYDSVGDVWWLSRYEDVAAVFADHSTYSASTYELSTGQVLGPTLISRDDYGHVVRRSIVAPDFVGKRLQRSLPLVDECSHSLIDRFIQRGSFDLVSDFSARLPVDVISAMLGMEGDGDLFRRWVTEMIQGLSGTAELRELGLRAHHEFCSHLAPALQNVQDPERVDHIAKIARAEVEGERLSHEEITAFCGLLFIAGGETTDKAIANMWWNLWSEPDRFAQVAEAPELWDNAFSETMRRTPPVVSEDRFTTTDVVWHGQQIPAQSRVRVSIGAAHLDETVFQNAEAFDLHRNDLHLTKELRSGGSTDPGRQGHLGFGLGKHFCIGYELARAEAVRGSQHLIERCPSLAPLHDQMARPQLQGTAFQAVASLPLTFDAPV